MTTTDQPIAEDFESTGKVLKGHYEALSRNDKENFNDLVLGTARQIVQGASDAEVQAAILLGDSKTIFERLGQALVAWCAKLDPGKLHGFPVDLVAQSLRYHLAFGFEAAARSRDLDDWRLPFGNMVASAIHDRMAQINRENKVREFLERLGPAEDPDAPAPPRAPDPTEMLRGRADLNPVTKVNVLKNYIDHANRGGVVTDYGTKHYHFLTCHSRSLEAARRFFQANPRLTVQDLIEFLACASDALTCPLPREGEDEDIAILQKCRDLSYLLVMLPVIRKHHEFLFDIPLDRFLTKAELFGRNFDPSAVLGGNDPCRPPLAGS